MAAFNGYRISSPYGWRTHPIRGGSEFHAGIDLVKEDRAPIEAFTAGTVLYAGMGQPGTGIGGYGNIVVIKDKYGKAQLYGHLYRTAVKKGIYVKRGQMIGYQGSTGQATGSHLHYEVRRKSSPKYGWESDKTNSTLNPTQYLEYYDTDNKPTSTSATSAETYKIYKTINGYLTADHAKRRVNKKSSVIAGNYFVFNRSQGMINVTSKKIVPGSWVNPRDNKTSSKHKKLVLPGSAASWRVYPLSKSPAKGNEIGTLNPKKFGGLKYDILANPQKDVYTIQTRNFGRVNIIAPPSTGAKIV